MTSVDVERIRQGLSRIEGKAADNRIIKDMGELVSEVERLRTQLVEMERQRDWYQDQCSTYEGAGQTISAYLYSIVNPGTIPTGVKNAMRSFETRLDAADAPERIPH